MKALIITHVDNIRDQWYNAFLKFTNIKEDRMFNIVGSSTIQSILKGEVDADIYFINHKTILSYAQANGWESVGDFIKKLKIGIKVYDEAHLCFRNILRTDMFSNVYKTFYLSATFDRSDDKESRIFKKAFANTERFGRGCDGYVDRDKNIIYVPLLYRSEMNERDQAKCMTNYGFSFNRYLDIMLSEYNDKLLNMVLYAIHLCNKIEGRVLITTSTVESIKIFKELINKYVGKTKYVGLYYSGLSSEEKEDVINNADIIISTIRGNGTGSDIKRLRAIINIESFSSPIIANQLAGRLRPYGNEDSYLFDIVDLSHNSLNNQYKSRLKQMKLKCKDIRALKVKYVYNPFIED
jgi:superfamily II DNA or RNA helicase